MGIAELYFARPSAPVLRAEVMPLARVRHVGRLRYDEPIGPEMAPVPAPVDDVRADYGRAPILYPAPIGPRLRSTVARSARPLARAVVAVVARSMGVSVDAIVTSRRFAAFQPARRAAAYVLVRVVGLSSAAAGRALGGRDHTTVLYHVGQASAALAAGDRQLIGVIMDVVAAFGLMPRLAAPSVMTPAAAIGKNGRLRLTSADVREMVETGYSLRAISAMTGVKYGAVRHLWVGDRAWAYRPEPVVDGPAR